LKAIESEILIVDVIGELSGWWGFADIAFVGGSMGSRGGQNMIEPAAYGLPVCFGPNTANFKTTVDGLLSEDAAVVVRDSNELAEFVSGTLVDQGNFIAIGKRAQEFVLKHRGAADRTVAILDEILLRVDDWRLDRAA
jgi:3-deoxy-D-manno-octulosonic-acid transferase